jgi:hypothetical protein
MGEEFERYESREDLDDAIALDKLKIHALRNSLDGKRALSDRVIAGIFELLRIANG